MLRIFFVAACVSTLLCALQPLKKLQRITLDGGKVSVAIDVTAFGTLGQFDAAPDGTVWVTGAVVPWNPLTHRYGRDGTLLAAFSYGSVLTTSDAAGSQFETIAAPAADSDADSFPDRAEVELGFDALDPVSRPDALRAAPSGPSLLTLQIESPRHALAPYLVLAALSVGQGPTPSAPCACPRIPLAPDGLLRQSLMAPPLLPAVAGILDANGDATALAVIPPQFAGTTIQLSALLDNATLTLASTQPVAVTLP